MPGVFSPVYSSDTAWFAEKLMPLINGKSFLEIGAGTGAIACLTKIHGATKVTATDINPEAIKNIKLNTKTHFLNISIKKGNVFDPIQKNESYDIIFWNHPFYYNDDNAFEKDMINASVCDNRYKFLKEFFKKGKDHLNREGMLLLGSSNIARINLIKKFARESGYSTTLIEKTEAPVYQGKEVKMDLIIYTFKIKK